MSDIGIIRNAATKPMTRLALTLDRLTRESGHPVATILAHVGSCPGRNMMLRMCRSFLFDTWDRLDGETGEWHADDRGYAARKWATYSAMLLKDIDRAN